MAYDETRPNIKETPMFGKKKTATVRILDTPLQLTIKPDVILVPYKTENGADNILLITGAFEHITDQEAYRLAADTIDKIKVA